MPFEHYCMTPPHNAAPIEKMRSELFPLRPATSSARAWTALRLFCLNHPVLFPSPVGVSVNRLKFSFLISTSALLDARDYLISSWLRMKDSICSPEAKACCWNQKGAGLGVGLGPPYFPPAAVFLSDSSIEKYPPPLNWWEDAGSRFKNLNTLQMKTSKEFTLRALTFQ